MEPRHKASAAAVELIKRFEGYRRKAAQLADGRWTIGYGHTRTARQGAEVSERDAESLLLYDLIAVQKAVNELTFCPLSQNQFDALTSFAFNVGTENFARSTVLRRLNEGAMIQAACALEVWRQAELDGERIIVDALVRRRSAEKTLFLTPAGGWVPAPSAIVRPEVDSDVEAALPRASTEVTVPLDGERGEAHRTPLEAETIEQAAANPEREPQPEPADEAPPAAADEAPVTRPEALRRIVRREAPIETESPPGADHRLGEASLLALGFVGLSVFAGSIFWGINTKSAGDGLDPMLLASLFGLVGIACVSTAVYLLLVRLGGRGD